MVLAHWNNSPWVGTSLYSDTLSWFEQTGICSYCLMLCAKQRNIHYVNKVRQEWTADHTWRQSCCYLNHRGNFSYIFAWYCLTFNNNGPIANMKFDKYTNVIGHLSPLNLDFLIFWYLYIFIVDIRWCFSAFLYLRF